MKSNNSDNHEEETPIAPHAVTDFFGEVIHSYTRSQAVEDDTLILASEQLAREAGFVIPVAYTSSVYTNCIEWTAEDDDRTGCIQDQKCREWDVLNMAFFAARGANLGVSVASFILHCVSRFEQSSTTTQLIKLLSEVGPDDHGGPCLTIMYPHER